MARREREYKDKPAGEVLRRASSSGLSALRVLRTARGKGGTRSILRGDEVVNLSSAGIELGNLPLQMSGVHF